MAASSAKAALITGVTAVASTVLDPDYVATRLVDNSGLSENSFTASNVVEVRNSNGTYDYVSWISTASSSTPISSNFVTFNLGGTYNLTDVYLWQVAPLDDFAAQMTMNQYDLLVSFDGVTFVEALANQILAKPAIGATSSNRVGLLQSGVSHVRIRVDSNHGGDYVSLGEVKFDGVSSVPEPSSLVMACVGLLSLFRRRR